LARKNSERMGTETNSGTPSSGALTAEALQEKLLSFPKPVELVDLPSKGKYYPDGHPLRNKEHIEIRHMTAKDEDILTSKSLLKKGVAIDRLLKNIITDKTIPVETLLVGDRNALLIAARISGYGGEYTTGVTCPACASTQEFSFELGDCTSYHGDDWGEFEISETGTGTFNIILPMSEVTVEVRLLNGYDERRLASLIENKRKKKLPESTLTDQLNLMIASVEGHTDKTFKKTLIENMPALDARYLRKAYEKLVPTVDLTHSFQCSNCEHEGEMEVPFTTDFFWPK
jgi:hypothetical protein